MLTSEQKNPVQNGEFRRLSLVSLLCANFAFKKVTHLECKTAVFSRMHFVKNGCRFVGPSVFSSLILRYQ